MPGIYLKLEKVTTTDRSDFFKLYTKGLPGQASTQDGGEDGSCQAFYAEPRQKNV